MIKENPLVTVIIPCYNAEKYVESSVKSIMNQTYKNLEILITDDCSKDNTYEILKKLASEDSRIRLFKNETNKKIVLTLNELVSHAKGKYIARMDADDISLPNRIEMQVSFLELNSEYGMCGTNAINIDENGKFISKTKLPSLFDEVRTCLMYYSCIYHPTVMIKSNILKENLYSEEFPYAEDYELWARLVFQKNIKIGNLKDFLLNYRIFNNQSCNVHRNEQISSCAKIFDQYDIICKENITNHKNIFFLHKKPEVSEWEYIASILSSISKNEKSYIEIYKKLLFHVKNYYPLNRFIYICLKKNGFKAFMSILLGKI